MSTKKIREMMKHYQSITNVEGVPRKVQLIDVIEEVEAIERAAKTLAKCSIGFDRGITPAREAQAAHDLIHSIAKEAP